MTTDQKGDYDIKVNWDREARVWVATSEDVPGLVAQADSYIELSRILDWLIPDLSIQYDCVAA